MSLVPFSDQLCALYVRSRRYAEHIIVTAAKIVGNNSDGDFVSGYEWCIEQVRNTDYRELASGLEIQKAIAYLREDNFPKVSAGNAGTRCWERQNGILV